MKNNQWNFIGQKFHLIRINVFAFTFLSFRHWRRNQMPLFWRHFRCLLIVAISFVEFIPHTLSRLKTKNEFKYSTILSRERKSLEECEIKCDWSSHSTHTLSNDSLDKNVINLSSENKEIKECEIWNKFKRQPIVHQWLIEILIYRFCHQLTHFMEWQVKFRNFEVHWSHVPVSAFIISHFSLNFSLKTVEYDAVKISNKSFAAIVHDRATRSLVQLHRNWLIVSKTNWNALSEKINNDWTLKSTFQSRRIFNWQFLFRARKWQKLLSNSFETNRFYRWSKSMTKLMQLKTNSSIK